MIADPAQQTSVRELVRQQWHFVLSPTRRLDQTAPMHRVFSTDLFVGAALVRADGDVVLALTQAIVR